MSNTLSTLDWLPVVTEAVEHDSFITIALSIPKIGADKLRKVKEFTGLDSIEDVVKFLLAIAVDRVESVGYIFDESNSSQSPSTE